MQSPSRWFHWPISRAGRVQIACRLLFVDAIKPIATSILSNSKIAAELRNRSRPASIASVLFWPIELKKFKGLLMASTYYYLR